MYTETAHMQTLQSATKANKCRNIQFHKHDYKYESDFVGQTVKGGWECEMLSKPFSSSSLMPDLVFQAVCWSVCLLIQSLVNVTQGEQ